MVIQYLAWPFVILILGIIAIFVFKQPLTGFLDRAEKIGKGGIQAFESLERAKAGLTERLHLQNGGAAE